MKKSFILGVMASFFFAFTFVLNSKMNISGGFWGWSASLRFIFMLPLLFLLLKSKENFVKIINIIKENPLLWILWSTIGFGLFYAPLCFAADYSVSWVVAGIWQITIIAGMLLLPVFFNQKIPIKSLLLSCIILAGVFIIQFHRLGYTSTDKILLGIIPVVIAAFAYPLGNRKMIELCHGTLTATQRIFGMTLCSMPFWILLSFYNFVKVGLPSNGQVFQSFIVALASGTIATILFFKATDLAKDNQIHLAIIESTQSGEIIFSLLGEVLFLSHIVPDAWGWIGMSLIILGSILNCFQSQIFVSSQKTKPVWVNSNLPINKQPSVIEGHKLKK